jgi:hypothetical protein
MKKLAVVGMIIVPATFMAVAMTSAGGHHWKHWWGIHGTYAMTGVGTCITSPWGFTENFTPPVDTPGPPPVFKFNFSGSNLYTGTWTFKRNGHGDVEGFLFGTATSAYPTPNASKISIKFTFTYTLEHDGTIYATMDEETFEAKGVTGPLKGVEYTVQGLAYLGDPPILTRQPLSFFGRVSPDQSRSRPEVCRKSKKGVSSRWFLNPSPGEFRWTNRGGIRPWSSVRGITG